MKRRNLPQLIAILLDHGMIVRITSRRSALKATEVAPITMLDIEGNPATP